MASAPTASDPVGLLKLASLESLPLKLELRQSIKELIRRSLSFRMFELPQSTTAGWRQNDLNVSSLEHASFRMWVCVRPYEL